MDSTPVYIMSGYMSK